MGPVFRTLNGAQPRRFWFWSAQHAHTRTIRKVFRTENGDGRQR